MQQRNLLNDMTLEGAIGQTILFLKAVCLSGQVAGHFDYDLYAPRLAEDWTARNGGHNMETRAEMYEVVVPLFMEAAWELSKRAILRPGVSKLNGYGNPGGNGYSITTYGRDGSLRQMKQTGLLLSPVHWRKTLPLCVAGMAMVIINVLSSWH